MAIEMKEQTAMTALRDELRKVFEPFGARVEGFEVQLGSRLLRWLSRTPHYPSHHVGGAFEEWTTSSRHNKRHQIAITIVRDETILDPKNAIRHRELFEGEWIPERLSSVKIAQLLNTFGLPLVDPAIAVICGGAIWSTR